MKAVVFTPTIDGIIAALLAPFFMSFGFYIWDMRWTSSKGSAFALNMFKCNVASIWFAIMVGIRGFALDDYVQVFTVTSVGHLALSSTLGIVIGDVLWLEALRLLGAKHVIVADSLKPFAAAILGRFFLGETLHPLGYVGMGLTVLGVGIVAWEGQTNVAKNVDSDDLEQVCSSKNLSDRCNKEEQTTLDDINIRHQQQIFQEDASEDHLQKVENAQFIMKEYKRGYICAILNVLADSFGSLLTKQYGAGMTTWSINLIRFGFAGMVLLVVSIAMRLYRLHWLSDKSKKENVVLNITDHLDGTSNTAHDTTTPETSKEYNKNPEWFELPNLRIQGWLQIISGVAFVTFLCPALEKFTLMQTALALCAALTSIGPLYGVFMDWFFKSRRPTSIGFVGALLAIGGVIVLCVFGI